MTTTISFDKLRLERLKLAYAEAVKHYQELFQFEGQPMLTSYAKYLIEYLEVTLGESHG